MSFSPKGSDAGGLLLAGLSIAYPFMAVAAIRHVDVQVFVALLCALLLLRLALPSARALPADLLWGMAAVAAVVAATAVFDAELGARIYPVATNAALLHAFMRTLWRPPSMIERFARMVEPDLDAEGVRYTRKLTMIWAGFFVVNGSVALWLALFGSWLAWAIWTGALAYVAAGLLFALEYLVRLRIRHRRVAAP